mgnify:CR=1 FL=1
MTTQTTATPVFQQGDRIVCADGTARTVRHMAPRITGEPARVVVEDGTQWIAANCQAAYASRALPPRDATCARPGCGHTGADHHHRGTACWANPPRTQDQFGTWGPVAVCQYSAFQAADH